MTLSVLPIAISAMGPRAAAIIEKRREEITSWLVRESGSTRIKADNRCRSPRRSRHWGRNAPFGGEKNSGLGRFNGGWAMQEFTRDHWITLQYGARSYPFWFEAAKQRTHTREPPHEPMDQKIDRSWRNRIG
jgi:hypothetical protein